MCVYGSLDPMHYACVPCRVSFKRLPRAAGHPCPRCARPMVCAGRDFAAPRRRDRKAWSVVGVVLAAGLRYEGFEACGCGREPKFRPRTRAQVRARRVVAARTGVPLAEVLGRVEPTEPGRLAGPPEKRLSVGRRVRRLRG
ncbi:hypothetical protein [Streptomyces sp.]|uniref:hypothetical protein n=1 Tax=Streptomyces sp. TaxID=1931 RepID=UPI0028110547|nr:hypothetical protein [Streptomyces sp.]